MEDKFNATTKLLPMANTAVYFSEQLFIYAYSEQHEEIMLVANDLKKNLQRSLAIITWLQQGDVPGSKATVPYLDIRNEATIKASNYYKISVESTLASLERVGLLCKARSPLLLDKIRFELIPLCKVVHEKLYRLHEELAIDLGIKLDPNSKVFYPNMYNQNYRQAGKFKYDVSVVVTANNKLEYTKKCMESLLEFMPQDVNYELILLNHGSTDGTKEYFESISPTKQIDILRNGIGGSVIEKILEGKNRLAVSNDVIIGKNAIKNMLACLESDQTIAYIVPSTPNVSNFQSIPVPINTEDQLQSFAETNNICNPYRWEQRFRLCNPISLMRLDIDYDEECYKRFKSREAENLFPDDKHSWLVRRSGFKNILAKDAYCYHFGSVTIAEEVNQQGSFDDYYLKGRHLFKEVLGIDPWELGSTYDPVLCEYLPCTNKGKVSILAFNCGYGSTPLKIKEKIKEVSHNLDVRISAVTDNLSFALDARILSDDFLLAKSLEEVKPAIENKHFDYIILETQFQNSIYTLEDLLFLYSLLNKDGIMATKVDSNILRMLETNFKDAVIQEYWVIIKN